MSVKTEKVFFDTNILIYQFDHTAPAKQQRAQQLIERYLSEGSGLISSQVVQEFMHVALRKFATTLQFAELKLLINELLKPLCAHTPTFAFYERALILYATNKLGFYDALIVQAALDLDCAILYSEDLQDGRQFGHLKICNPFA